MKSEMVSAVLAEFHSDYAGLEIKEAFRIGWCLKILSTATL